VSPVGRASSPRRHRRRNLFGVRRRTTFSYAPSDFDHVNRSPFDRGKRCILLLRCSTARPRRPHRGRNLLVRAAPDDDDHQEPVIEGDTGGRTAAGDARTAAGSADQPQDAPLFFSVDGRLFYSIDSRLDRALRPRAQDSDATSQAR